ncbi:MAG TPA: response regulator [Thermoanaerobaculia bacterium]
MPGDQPILVVDDDDAIRTLISRVLTRDGHTVEQAANGAEALDKLRARDCRVMVLDLMMPVLSGFEVLRYLEEHDDAGTPCVIVASAAASPAVDTAKAVRCVHAVLRKPFDIDALRQAVNACLAAADDGQHQQ